MKLPEAAVIEEGVTTFRNHGNKRGGLKAPDFRIYKKMSLLMPLTIITLAKLNFISQFIKIIFKEILTKIDFGYFYGFIGSLGITLCLSNWIFSGIS